MDESYEKLKAITANSPARHFENAVAAANPGKQFTLDKTYSIDLSANFVPQVEALIADQVRQNPDITDEDLLAQIKNLEKYRYLTVGDDVLIITIPDQALLEFIHSYRG